MTNEIVQKVADCLVRAGSTFREDQKEAYRRAIGSEMNVHTCWVTSSQSASLKREVSMTAYSLMMKSL